MSGGFSCAAHCYYSVLHPTLSSQPQKREVRVLPVFRVWVCFGLKCSGDQRISFWAVQSGRRSVCFLIIGPHFSIPAVLGGGCGTETLADPTGQECYVRSGGSAQSTAYTCRRLWAQPILPNQPFLNLGHMKMLYSVNFPQQKPFLTLPAPTRILVSPTGSRRTAKPFPSADSHGWRTIHSRHW